MNYFFIGLWCVILLSIFYQDVKERKVYLLLFIINHLLGFYVFFTECCYIDIRNSIILNLILILTILLILYSYCKIKLKIKLLNAIALGDILFFTGLAVSFPTISFLTIFSFSLIFSLILFLILKPKLNNKTVPLAGFQALFLTIILITNKLLSIYNIYI